MGKGDHEVVDEVKKVSASQPHPSLAELVPPSPKGKVWVPEVAGETDEAEQLPSFHL